MICKHRFMSASLANTLHLRRTATAQIRISTGRHSTLLLRHTLYRHAASSWSAVSIASSQKAASAVRNFSNCACSLIPESYSCRIGPIIPIGRN
jgi:hypothetical protein